MNRTDRLYAIVEELRAGAPAPRTARWLAARFEVAVRTIERDISALQQGGSPIWAQPGRTGGYYIDASRTLPPVNFTPQEAVAMAVALQSMPGTPFHQPAQSALRKIVAAMNVTDAAAARLLAEKVHLLGPDEAVAPAEAVPALIADALSSRRVLRIDYRDRSGSASSRDIEPLGYVVNGDAWFLVAWCRLRGGVRAFRTDRIVSTAITAEVPEPRTLSREDLDIPYGEVRGLPPL
ncbi:YafY family protein [Glaciihabitans sp. dw_435]|uniref:helix-turn-helix transcriptional regulator n=1 Tax=Glaciihabitans sp. dw_435 TaxID=2720081 RepID=UPI001BD1F3CA|nr:YafY family protein [Glaciihabitans sp. dw_435]